jgi:DNA-binding Lrp family transcriptional regulator
MTGGADLLVKILAKDIDDLNELVTEKLRNVEGVDQTQTAIVLKAV